MTSEILHLGGFGALSLQEKYAFLERFRHEKKTLGIHEGAQIWVQRTQGNLEITESLSFTEKGWGAVLADGEKTLVEIVCGEDLPYQIETPKKRLSATKLAKSLLALHRLIQFEVGLSREPSSERLKNWRQPPYIEFLREFAILNLDLDNPWPDIRIDQVAIAEERNELIKKLRQKLRSRKIRRAALDWDFDAQSNCGQWKKVANMLFEQHEKLIIEQAVLSYSDESEVAAQAVVDAKASTPDEAPLTRRQKEFESHVSLHRLHLDIEHLINELRRKRIPDAVGYFRKLDWSPALGHHAHFILVRMAPSPGVRRSNPNTLEAEWQLVTEQLGRFAPYSAAPFPPKQEVHRDDVRARGHFDGWVIERHTLSTQQFRARAPGKTQLLTCGQLNPEPKHERAFVVTEKMRMEMRRERAKLLHRSSPSTPLQNRPLVMADVQTSIVHWVDRIGASSSKLFSVSHNDPQPTLQMTSEGQELIRLFGLMPVFSEAAIRLHLDPRKLYPDLRLFLEFDPRLQLFVDRYWQLWKPAFRDGDEWATLQPEQAANDYSGWVASIRRVANPGWLKARVSRHQATHKKSYQTLYQLFYRKAKSWPLAHIVGFELGINTPVGLNAQMLADSKDLTTCAKGWVSRLSAELGKSKARIALKTDASAYTGETYVHGLVMFQRTSRTENEWVKAFETIWKQVVLEAGRTLTGWARSTDIDGSRYRGVDPRNSNADTLLHRVQSRIAYLAWADDLDGLTADLKPKSLLLWPSEERTKPRRKPASLLPESRASQTSPKVESGRASSRTEDRDQKPLP